MSYQIVFYNQKVESTVLGWPPGIAAHFVRIAARMTEHGPDLGMPYTRAMRGGLFEIRARGAEGIGRALFCCVAGRKIVILHGFIKKSQQTPPSEIQIARQRMKELGRVPQD